MSPGLGRAPGSVGSVMTIGLSINRCALTRNTADKNKKLDGFRGSCCGDFRGLTRFRQKLLNQKEINSYKILY